MSYDDQNVFAKILRSELPCTKVHETEYSLSFQDIAPQAKVHVLVIPKGAFVDWRDFAVTASADEQVAFIRMIAHVADITGIAGSGYRAISNIGRDGGQEVPHLHMHVLGGEPVGPLVARG